MTRRRRRWLPAGSSVPLLLGLALSAAPGVADAAPSRFLERENPLASWLPSPEERATRERARLEQELARALQQQPGVEQVAVVLSLPPVARVPLDQAVPAVRASIALRMRGHVETLPRLRELAAGVLPPGAEIQLTRSEAKAARRPHGSATQGQPRVGARVGPFQVEGQSAGWLRATLAGLLGTNALLAGLLLWRRARG